LRWVTHEPGVSLPHQQIDNTRNYSDDESGVRDKNLTSSPPQRTGLQISYRQSPSWHGLDYQHEARLNNKRCNHSAGDPLLRVFPDTPIKRPTHSHNLRLPRQQLTQAQPV
jgi:hypothetical protein